MNATRAPSVTPGFKRMHSQGSVRRVYGAELKIADDDRITRELFDNTETSPQKGRDLLKEKPHAQPVKAGNFSKVRYRATEESRSFQWNRSDPKIIVQSVSLDQGISAGSDRSDAFEATQTCGEGHIFLK